VLNIPGIEEIIITITAPTPNAQGNVVPAVNQILTSQSSFWSVSHV
jgi:hypothetical protein